MLLMTKVSTQITMGQGDDEFIIISYHMSKLFQSVPPFTHSSNSQSTPFAITSIPKLSYTELLSTSHAHFSTLMDWVLGRGVDKSHSVAFTGNTKVTDLIFADNAVILAQLLEVLQWHCKSR